MRPRLAPLALVALAVLVPSPAARAVPITGYAFGYITKDYSTDYPNALPPRTFTVGERVTLSYTYDADVAGFPAAKSVAFLVLTGSGFELDVRSPAFGIIQGAWPDLRLAAATPLSTLELRFVNGEGIFSYEVDLPSYVAGFRASVIRTDTFLPVDAPVPEPSTLALGGIGGVLALGYAWRRRRAA